MRKTKLTLASLLVMAGTIGSAFALFNFGDTASKTNDNNISLEGYSDIGEITFGTLTLTNDTNTAANQDVTAHGFTIDGGQLVSGRDSKMAKSGSIQVKITLGENVVVGDLQTRTFTAAFSNTALDTYVGVTLTNAAAWTTDPITDDTFVTINFTFAWKANQDPEGSNFATTAAKIAQWEAIEAAATGNKLVFTATATKA